MPDGATFDEINKAKASMDHIYDEPDPRGYFQELRKLGYTIAGRAKPIFQELISHLREEKNDTIHILDIGCSYGINAALLKFDLTMDELYEHWNQKRLQGVLPSEIVEYDKKFFANLEKSSEIEMTGLDQAENAVEFAEDVGLLDDGVAADLETEPLPKAATEELATVDMVISTGCVGYVTEKTFERLLPTVTQDGAPWMAHFVLRMFPFDAIEEVLENWGYKTEKLEDRTFVQRTFASEEEQLQVLNKLRELEIDPTGLETKGHLLAEFYLSRPAKEVAEISLEELLAA
ncbi:MAG: class I SAM-dependent methyltransferase [Alphaproteobacteria bacterium]